MEQVRWGEGLGILADLSSDKVDEGRANNEKEFGIFELDRFSLEKRMPNASLIGGVAVERLLKADLSAGWSLISSSNRVSS